MLYFENYILFFPGIASRKEFVPEDFNAEDIAQKEAGRNDNATGNISHSTVREEILHPAQKYRIRIFSAETVLSS